MNGVILKYVGGRPVNQIGSWVGQNCCRKIGYWVGGSNPFEL